MDDRPQWAEKLRFWLTDTQYEDLNKVFGKINETAKAVAFAVESRIENGAERAEGVGLRLLCIYFGHKPVADQCDKPEHDFCVYCNKLMPNSAHGPQY